MKRASATTTDDLFSQASTALSTLTDAISVYAHTENPLKQLCDTLAKNKIKLIFDESRGQLALVLVEHSPLRPHRALRLFDLAQLKKTWAKCKGTSFHSNKHLSSTRKNSLWHGEEATMCSS